MLYVLVVTSCSGSLDLKEDINENFKISQQESLNMQARESDSTKTFSSENDIGLYPDPDEPDIPIKDTHDWRKKL